MPKKRPDRPCVTAALGKMRQATGFMLILDMPHDNPSIVADAIKRGEAPPTTLHLMVSPEFGKPRTAMVALAQTLFDLRGRYMPKEEREGLPPPIEMMGDLQTKSNGNLTLGPSVYAYMRFGTEGEYGEEIKLLFLEDTVPPGKNPGDKEATTAIKLILPAPATVDHYKVHLDEFEKWTMAQGLRIATETGCPLDVTQEMLESAVIQQKKAWENESE